MILSVISISWFLIGVLAVLSMLWLRIKSKRSYSTFNIPPFPVKPWPFVGHFFMIFTNLRDKIVEWREKVGDIYSLDLNGQLNIVVNNFSGIKDILIKHADHIVNTQHTFADEILDEYNTGILGARDDNWKEQRTTSLSILRSFGMGKNLMADKIEEEVECIIEKLALLKGQPKNVHMLLDISIANVICSVAVGKRFDYNDPYFVRLVSRLGTFLKYFPNVLALTPFKYLYSLPGDLFNAKKCIRSALEINEDFSKPFIHKYKKHFNGNEEPHNFITAYLKKMNDNGEGTYLDERNLIGIMRTLFSAGTDTTSNTILWCLLYMLHHPYVQEKVYHELETYVGTDRVPNIADKPKLTYLNAVIMETQRMSSLVPIGLRREVSSTFEYSGFTFPKGSILWPVLDSVLHDPKIWKDPENFRPERFIDKDGSLINREELIPFSIGRRQCMGKALAKMELFLFLSSLFQRFKFEPADKSAELPTLKAVFGTTLSPHPFKLKFVDRKI